MANLQLIRDLCVRRKMSIRELASRIGRDESTIQSAIRRGSTQTSTIEAIAKALDVSPGVFFDGYNPSDNLEIIRENKYLKEILQEKERLIEVLMKGHKSGKN